MKTKPLCYRVMILSALALSLTFGLNANSGQVVNGSFETGDFTGWVTNDLADPYSPLAINPDGFDPSDGEFFQSSATDGAKVLTTGFDGCGPGVISVAQDVAIAADKPQLTFDYRAGWDITVDSMDLDLPPSLPRIFYVTIEPDGGGTPLLTVTNLVATNLTMVADTGPLHGVIDLAGFVGSTVRIRFNWLVPECYTGPGAFQLDNVALKTPATVVLSNLNQAYNGNARSVTASTTPSGLAVEVVYNGSTDAPTNVGTYTVVGTIKDANYGGSTTNTLVIYADQIINGSFETGDFTGWITNDMADVLDPLAVHTNGYSNLDGVVLEATDGIHALTTGFDGCGPGVISVAQDVAIAADKPQLTFDYRAGWDITVPSSPEQTQPPALPRIFYVTIEPDGGGTPLLTVTNLVATNLTMVADSGPLHGMIDLAGFVGSTVRIRFNWLIPECYTGPAAFQLDKVALKSGICPTITLSPATLPVGTVGVSYNANISASGGVGGYTYSANGTLANGLTLSSIGEISGAPTNIGSFDFTITATDANGCTGSSNYTISVTCPAISMAFNPPPAVLLSAYSNPTPAGGDYFGASVAAVGSGRVLIGARGDDTGAADAGAAYLYSNNGTLLTTYTNPTPAVDDGFGYSVAVVGNDRVLVGAFLDDTGAVNAGAAYLFSTNGTLLITYTNPTPSSGEYFGASVVAVGSDRVLIGAPRDDTGVSHAGAAYLFSTNGSLITTFTNPTPATGDFFGNSVAGVGNDRVLIGAEQDDTGAVNAGAAYLFSTNGTLLTTFTDPAPAIGYLFGNPVAAVGSDRVLIGGGNALAVYLFSTNGSLITVFTSPTPTNNDAFGSSVAVVGSDRVAIGARQDSAGATLAGAAYLFSTNGSLITTFTKPTPTTGDFFGNSVVAVGSDRVLIGADNDDTGAVDAGAAYLFAVPSLSQSEGKVYVTYSNTLAASGGTLPYTFAVTAGSLPSGLSLSSGGAISGTPTNIGSFTFTITATDADGCPGSFNYTLAITGSGVADTTAPTLTVTSPKNNSRVPDTNSLVTVTGTAKDNKGGGGVAAVTYSINGGAFQPVETANGYTNWTASVPLHAANNSFVVEAMDFQGNQKILTNTFYLMVSNSLVIEIRGTGSVLGKTTKFGTPADGAVLEIGKNYQLTATPGDNYLFSNWLAAANSGPTNEVSTAAKYSFTMQSNMMLVANFVPNRFLSVTGKYNGLFLQPGNIQHSNSGFFSATVSDKQGKPATFSGKLLLDGDALRFNGSFGLDGNDVNTKSIDRSKHSKSTLALRLHLPFDGSGTLSGTVSNGVDGWVTPISSDLAVATMDYAGSYTMVLPGGTNTGDFHGGDGSGVVTIDANGVIKLLGNLGDGAAFNQTVPIGTNGAWPLYVAAYKDGNSEYQGSILGWLTVTNAPAAIEGALIWNKNAAAGGPLYVDGFSSVVDVVASPYTNAALAGLREILLKDGSNGVVVLNGGNLTTGITNLITLSTMNKFKAPTTNTAGQVNKLTLTLTPKTGKLTGSFKPDGVTAQKLTGVVLQNTNQGRGFFPGATNSGSWLLLKAN